MLMAAPLKTLWVVLAVFLIFIFVTGATEAKCFTHVFNSV